MITAEHRRSNLPAYVLLAASATGWLIALPSTRTARVTQWGLLFSASPLLLASIVLAGVAFAYCIRHDLLAMATAALVLLVVTQRLPTLVSTQAALLSSTYKHLGVVDYIQKHGHVAHGIDVYHGWPGAFAFSAWFSEITGVAPGTVAHVFIFSVHLVLLGLTYVVARTWGLDKRGALVAAFLFEALNWVAQDYFSPQAFAIVLAAGFLILVGLSRERIVAAPVMLLLFVAIDVTHQLTPYWLILAVVVLTAIKRLPSWWLAAALIGITGAVLAFNYDTAQSFGLLSLNPLFNARSNVPNTGVAGQQVTASLMRLVSGGFWLSAAVCGFRAWRHQSVRAAAVLAFSSFLLLAGASYGGEAIFRVFLFSLFGCSILVAPTIARLLTARGATVAACVGAVLVAAVAGSAQGYFGQWFGSVMSPAQVKESRSLLETIEPEAYVTAVAPVWPWRSSAAYADRVVSQTYPGGTFDLPMLEARELAHKSFAKRKDYDLLVRLLGQRIAPTYLILSDQMRFVCTYFGYLPDAAFPNLERWLRGDRRWTVYKRGADFVIFRSTSLLIAAN